MEEVLEKYNLSKLKQRERRNLNSTIFVEEMQFLKNSTKQIPDPDSFPGEFFQIFKE